jgi:hypothetical protein
MNKKHRYTVELLLDVSADDPIEAELIGKWLASFARREAAGIFGAVVSDVRQDDEDSGGTATPEPTDG